MAQGEVQFLSVSAIGEFWSSHDDSRKVNELESFDILRINEDNDYYDTLKTDIQVNGIREPLQYSIDPYSGLVTLFEGHHRWMIAEELGITNAPVIDISLSDD